MDDDSKTAEIFLGSSTDLSLENLDDAMELEKDDKSVDDVSLPSDTNSTDRPDDNNDTVVVAKKSKQRGSKELTQLLNSLRDSHFDPIHAQKRKKSQINYNKPMEKLTTPIGDEFDENSRKRKKRESTDSNKSTMNGNNRSGNVLERTKSFSDHENVPDKKDGFCWHCHREGQLVSCQACPRSFHNKCLGSQYTNYVKITCPECMAILQAESIKSRSFAMRNMSIDQLCELLKYAVKKMMQCEGSDPFLHQVDEIEFPDYYNYIVNPMDISKLERHIFETKYGSTEAFVADVKWILHNSIIFNSVQSKITTYAKNIVRICKQEMAEIENCHECYLRSNICAPDWFIEPCSRPHILLWAKLKGFPFWPAKAMTANQNFADVRFFGAHDRAWVPIKDCFLYSEKEPNKRLSKNDGFLECLQEVIRHIKKLEEKFGQFNFAPFQTIFIPDDAKQINIFLPNYAMSEENMTSPQTNFARISSPGRTTSPLSANGAPDGHKNIDPRKESAEKKNAIRRSRRSNESMEGYGTEEEDFHGNQSLNLEVRKNFNLLNDSGSESDKSEKSVDDSNTVSNLLPTGNEFGPKKLETEMKTPPLKLLDRSQIKVEVLNISEPRKINRNHEVVNIKTEVLSDHEHDQDVNDIVNNGQCFSENNSEMSPIVLTSASTVVEEDNHTEMQKIDQVVKSVEESTNSRAKPIPSNNTDSEQRPNASDNIVGPGSSTLICGQSGISEAKHFSKPIPILINPKVISKFSSVVNLNGCTTFGTNRKAGKIATIPNLGVKHLGGPSTSSARQKTEEMNTRFATDEMPSEFVKHGDLPTKVQEIIEQLPCKPLPNLIRRSMSGIVKQIDGGLKQQQPAAGTFGKIVDLASIKMNTYFKTLLGDVIKEINDKGSNDARVKSLELEMESLKKAQAEQIHQLKGYLYLTLNEMQKASALDKLKALDEAKIKWEHDKNKAVADAKLKQWCAYCRKEAQFYCCWNTSYCDYPCQVKHWDVHMKTCKQCTDSNEVADSSKVPAVHSNTGSNIPENAAISISDLEEMQREISHSGLLARSPEGHAARGGMQIKGNEDMWIEIQANTFRNWVNEHLHSSLMVDNLSEDFCTGVRLCSLVETLQKKAIRPSWNKRPINQHHYLENVTAALNAIERDGVKLVNIGNTDIVNGNLKLILGLIWSLIVRYQIGRSKFPPRKLMLAWLQAVLPDLQVHNLTTDWNSGIALSALIDFCKPGLLPYWKSLDESHAVENCKRAMNIAQKELNVPAILEPEYLASPWIDELSGMTYLSYFLKQNSPGYHAILEWVNEKLSRPVTNFTTDWNNGYSLCDLVRSFGGSAPPPEKLNLEQEHWYKNIVEAMKAATKLGIEPVLSGQDLSDRNVEHLGVMAYISQFMWISPRAPLHDLIKIRADSTSVRTGESINFIVEIFSHDLSKRKLTAEISGPDSRMYNINLDDDLQGSFVPKKFGMHKLIVYYDEQDVASHWFRAIPSLIYSSPPAMAPYPIGSLVEVLVNATGAPNRHEIRVTAYSPSNRALECPLKYINGTNSAIFKPDEPGEWIIEITYQGKPIQGGPYNCSVFDPDGVEVSNLDGAMPLVPHYIKVNTRNAGSSGEIVADVVHDKRSIHCRTERIGSSGYEYKLHFTPIEPGKHRVYIYFNGYDIKNSPFTMKIGSRREKKITNLPNISACKRSNSPSLYASANRASPIFNHMNGGSTKKSSRIINEYDEVDFINNNTSYTSNMDDSKSYESSSDYEEFKKNIVYKKKVLEKHVSNTTTTSNTPNYEEETPFESTDFEETKKNMYNHSSQYVNNGDDDTVDKEPKNYFRQKLEKNSNNIHDDDEFETTKNVYKKETKHVTKRKEEVHSPIYSKTIRESNSRIFERTSEERETSPYLNTSSESMKKFYEYSENRDENTTTSTSNRKYLNESFSSMNLSNGSIRDNKQSSTNANNGARSSPLKKKHSKNSHNKNDDFFNEVYENGFTANQYESSGRNQGRVSDVKVTVPKQGYGSEPVEILINGNGAGTGDLEILIENGKLTSNVESLGEQKFKATFVPKNTKPHRVDILFNGVPVSGSPWHVDIMPSSSGSVLGEATRLIAANTTAVFEIVTTSTINQNELKVHVISPTKKTVPSTVSSGDKHGVFNVEFVPVETGTHFIEVSIDGEKLVASPLIAKVYNTSLITVSDVQNGLIGQPVQFQVDASQAGEGQLEISINDAEVPNHVQVIGGGRCLVTFTPEQIKPHFIDIKFNGEPVKGCPIMCKVSDTSQISLNLSHLEFIGVNEKCSFLINVPKNYNQNSDKLSVSVRDAHKELPVKIQGNVHAGLTVEFTPVHVGAHQIFVEFNDVSVNGTPFLAKAFDVQKIQIGHVNNGVVGAPVTFSVDASESGEGNLEITISSRGMNIPTQVHPQGSAKFAVTFVPIEPHDHIINVAFNKRIISGCPVKISVKDSSEGPTVTLPGPSQVHKQATLLIHHKGKLDDLDVNVEGPGGQSIPAQVHFLEVNQFQAEFVPKNVGEHKIFLSVNGQITHTGPYAVKVYDVKAIKVKDCPSGIVGKHVTFLVETSQAGPGNLEVTVNGGRVPTSAQAQGAHTYAITFTPRESILHLVDLKFNGQEVPGSPFRCSISPAAKILTGEVMDKVSAGDACVFIVESPQMPTVEILGPSRRSLPVQIKPNRTNVNKFDIVFSPVDVGDHSVEVRLPGTGGHIEGSPFLIKAYDADKVIVTDISDGIVGKPISFSINASQAGAGNLEIIVAVSGRNVPNFVQSEGNARFKVNFKPAEAAVHTISVRFNGISVPGSPFSCNIAPGNLQCRIAVSGSGVGVTSVKKKAEIKAEKYNGIEPEVIVTNPMGAIVDCTKVAKGNFVFYNFQPENVGRHSVSVFITDQHVLGSPFSCNVYDVAKVKVSGLPGRKNGIVNGASSLSVKDLKSTAEVGKPVTFNVDAAQAGEGTLELVVSTNHSTVKAEVVACSRGLYDVTFVPNTSDDHYVNITFNDELIPGSPFQCAVNENVQYLPIGATASVELASENHYLEILSPKNNNVSFTLKDLSAEFQLSEIGTYKVQIMNQGSLVTTKTIHVFDVGKIEVFDSSDNFVHRPALVKINTANSGPGKLSAIVKVGPKIIPHSLRQNGVKTSSWELIFHPVDIAPHKVYLFYNNVPKLDYLETSIKPIGTEPWAGGIGLYQAQVKKVSNFIIDTFGKPARDFDVVISNANDKATAVRCFQTKQGKLQAEFTPFEIGPHKIEVLYLSQPISGSPFICQVFDHDAVIVQVPQTHNNLNESVVIKVNSQKSGSADLSVVIENPSGHLVPVHYSTIDNQLMQIWFIASSIGLYQVRINYGGIPLKDSPWIIAVNSSGLHAPPRALGEGLEKAEVNEKATFSVSCVIPPRIQIETPHECLDHVVQCVRPGEYIITYIPNVIGQYNITITVGGQKLAGCPFQVPVSNPKSIRILNDLSNLVNEQNYLKIPSKLVLDISKAGPGDLECTIAGRKVQIIQKKDGLVEIPISSEGLNSGEHDFQLCFNGTHVEGLPKLASSNGNQVILSGKGLSHSTCGELTSFTIDGSQSCPGSPEITLSPSNLSEHIPVILNLSGEKIWTAQYKLLKPGTYLLSVHWAGRLVKGCPLRIEAKGGADPSKVLCSGEGLRQGVVGKEIRSWIDTRRAGPGELVANCSGPTKVAYCELYDHGDATFTLNIKPQEAGKHTLTIKYAGSHVPDSPFMLKVAGAPEPSKVKVYGPGIEHGVLASFQSRFICDTRGAGAGQLTVRVKGPKNAFRVEMQRESQRDRTILCKFDPTEPGDYRIEVKWAGEHVPGSPFHVMIFDTQEELRRYLNSL